MRCPPLPLGGDEVVTLFGAVLLRAVRTVKSCCSSSLRELETVHKEGRCGSRFIMFGAAWLRAVWAASRELFVHSERIRAVTQGVYILNLCSVIVLC